MISGPIQPCDRRVLVRILGGGGAPWGEAVHLAWAILDLRHTAFPARYFADHERLRPRRQKHAHPISASPSVIGSGTASTVTSNTKSPPGSV
jgi:hypothetical protein